MRMWSSTQTSTGVRAAVAARLEAPLARIHCIAPDVGGGFGVRSSVGRGGCSCPGQRVRSAAT
ncbi:MAG: molybdopterin-dependent oxidoreductase [Phycicoccus sp.]|uniref:molybdopterin cofactor-binding domain-containing protein n=1 Tax=Phycicoccus sp. TaxID=1902410 RepID=UPI0025876684|nr:molybdopterin cofactor-binding domain-containing protein [Phycicoccus sp.]MCO5302489.1 molybdopterin-dependent oxidoreductase [Phycicoccus sp.]